MTQISKITLFSISLIFSSGCALLHQAHVGKYQRRVAAFEKVRPDQAELQRGEFKHSAKTLKSMNDWRSYIDLRAKYLTRQEKQDLVARIDRAKQRFLLQAASIANTSNLAYYLAKIALKTSAGSDNALRLVRKYARDRQVFRQNLFNETGTYRHRFKTEMVWKTTYAATHVSGNRSRSFHSRRKVRRLYNCVFSITPFGREGVRNNRLSYYFKGSSRIYGRCYSNRPIGSFRGYRGGFMVRIPVGIAGRYIKKAARRSRYRGSHNYVDFTLDANDPGHFSRLNKAHLNVKVTLLFVGYNDNKIVWFRGRRRLRPDWKTFELGSSSFFWERQ